VPTSAVAIGISVPVVGYPDGQIEHSVLSVTLRTEPSCHRAVAGTAMGEVMNGILNRQRRSSHNKRLEADDADGFADAVMLLLMRWSETRRRPTGLHMPR